MSRSSLQEYGDLESEGGSVLVDWGRADSTQSGHNNGAISLYDSDSSEELGNLKRSALLSGLQRNLTDDEEDSVDDCMILSDDDEDVDSEDEQEIVNRVKSSLASSSGATTTPLILPEPPASTLLSAGSNLSNLSNNTDVRQKAELEAIFVEDKPWRELTPWRRRPLGAHKTRFRSVDQSSDTKVEGEREREQENGTPRLKGMHSIFRSISLGNSASDVTPTTHREQKEKEVFDQWMDEEEEFFEEEVSVNSSQLSELDLEEHLDWDKLPPLPNSFLAAGMLHPSMSQYLDRKLQHTSMTHPDADHFALEHSLLLRAILQLLEERAIRGVAEFDIEDRVVLKQGALKKFSHSVGRPTWKVKYAEVRRGSFSYYEDKADDSKKARKTIPLAGCICQEAQHRIGYFVFELLSDNFPRRLFMCSSEEERQAWMRVIEEAKQEKNNPISLAPYQWSIDTYKTMQTNLRWSLSKGEYMIQFGDLYKLKLQLPIQWVLEQADENQKPRHAKARTVDFWKFLGKQTLVINGHEIPGESLHGPERIIGALSRGILEYDHSSQEEHAQHNLSEVQAVSYARDVLVAAWQSRARDDSHYTLDSMCQNSGLVIVLPLSEDPKMYVSVSYSATEDSQDLPPDYEVAQQMSGWVTTRSKTFKNWKNRYCVVSEGVLSYYEHANPRPHGLRGQVVLVGALLNVVEEKAREDMHLHILQIVSKDHERERYLSFRDEASFSKWKEAIQEAIDLCTPKTDPNSSPESPGRRRKINRVIPKGRLMQKGMEGGGRMIAEGGFKVMKGASNLFEKITRQKIDEPDFVTDLESHNADTARLEPSSVQIRVESCRHYKIITSDPTGDDKEDTWITVRANTCQIFKLSGGANGRFASDEELVELGFFKGLVAEEDTVEDLWSSQTKGSNCNSRLAY